MTISLIDSTSTSLTVSWPAIANATRYVLQYRKAVCGDSETFEMLSDKLTTTEVRKRNLEDADDTGFSFRVGAITDESNEDVTTWITHEEPFHLLAPMDEDSRMLPPKVAGAGSNHAVLVTWDTVRDASGYELQMRENVGGAGWSTVAASLSGTEARKKNLTSKLGYQFRVRPVKDYIGAFSSPSDVIVAMGLSDGMKRLFNSLENGTLLQNPNQQSIPLADALGGKEFVLLYASAHWCGPCRKFTPTLSTWYQSLPIKNVEVVFLSCDHDNNGFKSYYATMPWLAVAFDDDARERLLSHIRVTGIPRLVVLDGKSGSIIEDNAVGKPFDIDRWRRLAAAKK